MSFQLPNALVHWNWYKYNKKNSHLFVNQKKNSTFAPLSRNRCQDIE